MRLWPHPENCLMMKSQHFKRKKTPKKKKKKERKKTPQLKKQLHKSSKCKIQTLSLSLSLTHTHTHTHTHTYAHTHTHTLITPDRPLVQTHQRSAFSAGCVKRAIKVYTKQLATTCCTSECTWSFCGTTRRGLPWSLRDQAKIWSCFSVTKFGSATAQILLESGSSAKERFRFDLK